MTGFLFLIENINFDNKFPEAKIYLAFIFNKLLFNNFYVNNNFFMVICLLLFVFVFLLFCVFFLSKNRKIASKIKKNLKLRFTTNQKLCFYNLSCFEKKLLQRIKYNFVSCKNGMEDLAEQLARIGFDLHFPLIKVELNECKTLSVLRDYLCAIKRFEAMGYLFNISITFCENKNFYYKDIFYECCQMDLMSIVKVHQTEYVSVLLMNAINMYNINCENFDVYLGDLQTKISVEYKNKKYYFGREEYVGFKFKKKCVISENILIEDERIYNSEENVFIRKFQINNSYDKPIEVGFVYPVEIKDENGANCCVQFDKMKNRFFLKIDNDKSVENFATINFFDSYKMNKKIINFYKKIKVLPHQEFVFYVVGGDYLCGKIFTENDCEKLIVQSVQEYLKLPYIRLKSENKALNNLINFNLPQKIIKKHIFSSGKIVQDFLILKQENEGKILK